MNSIERAGFSTPNLVKRFLDDEKDVCPFSFRSLSFNLPFVVPRLACNYRVSCTSLCTRSLSLANMSQICLEEPTDREMYVLTCTCRRVWYCEVSRIHYFLVYNRLIKSRNVLPIAPPWRTTTGSTLIVSPFFFYSFCFNHGVGPICNVPALPVHISWLAN